jgi:hypothetical protein
MKKIIFLLLFSISFLNATTIYNGKCVETFKPIAFAEPVIEITYSHLGYGVETVPYSIELLNSLVENDGKFINSPIGIPYRKCSYISNSTYYGMTKEQYNFLMSLTGILIGFSILFFILGI